MTSVTLTEWTRPPDVPVSVMVLVPRWTFWRVSIVSTDVPDEAIDAGAKVAVARGGALLTERFTAPEKPDPAVTVTVYFATAPRVMVTLAGVADIEKSPWMTTVTVTGRVRGPLVPVSTSE